MSARLTDDELAERILSMPGRLLELAAEAEDLAEECTRHRSPVGAREWLDVATAARALARTWNEVEVG